MESAKSTKSSVGIKVDLERFRKKVNSDMKTSSSAEAVLSVVEQHIDSLAFDYIHVATAFTKLANLKIARTLSLATARRPVLQALIERVDKYIDQDNFYAQATANVLWAIPALREKAPSVERLVPCLLQSVKKNMDDLSPQMISNVIYACTRLQLSKEQLGDVMPLLAEKTIGKAGDFNAQDISNIIWACTQETLDACPDVKLLISALLNEVPRTVNDYKPLEISQIIWGIAELQHAMPVLKQYEVNVKDRKEELTSLLLGQAWLTLQDFDGRSLPNLCSGLARLSALKADFAGELAQEAVRQAPEWDAKMTNLGLPELAWAFAAADIYEVELMSMISEKGSSRLNMLNDWGVCSLSVSYRKFEPQSGKHHFQRFQTLLQTEISRRKICQKDANELGEKPPGQVTYLKRKNALDVKK